MTGDLPTARSTNAVVILAWLHQASADQHSLNIGFVDFNQQNHTTTS
jgi:hypothetical protein